MLARVAAGGGRVHRDEGGEREEGRESQPERLRRAAELGGGGASLRPATAPAATWGAAEAGRQPCRDADLRRPAGGR